MRPIRQSLCRNCQEWHDPASTSGSRDSCAISFVNVSKHFAVAQGSTRRLAFQNTALATRRADVRPSRSNRYSRTYLRTQRKLMPLFTRRAELAQETRNYRSAKSTAMSVSKIMQKRARSAKNQ
jgi:hypothetical protein